MGRVPRSELLQLTPYFHIICRANPLSPLFQDHEDFSTFCSSLGMYRRRWHFDIYHYVLMTTHVHLECFVEKTTHLSKTLHALQSRYCRYIQRKYNRTGHIWHSRFRSIPILSRAHLIRCGRYIELNSVAAGICDHPSQYQWSSYHVYANNKQDALVTVNPLYEEMGVNSSERQTAYKSYIQEGTHLDRNEEKTLFDPYSISTKPHRRMRKIRWLNMY